MEAANLIAGIDQKVAIKIAALDFGPQIREVRPTKLRPAILIARIVLNPAIKIAALPGTIKIAHQQVLERPLANLIAGIEQKGAIKIAGSRFPKDCPCAYRILEA